MAEYFTETEIEAAIKHELACLSPVSLNSFVGVADDGDGIELENFVPSDFPRPDEIVEGRMRSADIKEIINSIQLDPIDRDIIEFRFFRDNTLEETGESFGITRERTRQRQNRALRILRPQLRKYVDGQSEQETFEEFRERVACIINNIYKKGGAAVRRSLKDVISYFVGERHGVDPEVIFAIHRFPNSSRVRGDAARLLRDLFGFSRKEMASMFGSTPNTIDSWFIK